MESNVVVLGVRALRLEDQAGELGREGPRIVPRRLGQAVPERHVRVHAAASPGDLHCQAHLRGTDARRLLDQAVHAGAEAHRRHVGLGPALIETSIVAEHVGPHLSLDAVRGPRGLDVSVKSTERLSVVESTAQGQKAAFVLSSSSIQALAKSRRRTPGFLNKKLLIKKLKGWISVKKHNFLTRGAGWKNTSQK